MKLKPQDLGIGQLFTYLQDAVVVASVETGRIVLWNPAAERMLGYSAAEAVDQPIELIIPDRFKRAHQSGLQRYRETGHGAIVDAGRPVEVWARHSSGREFPIDMSLSPINDAQVDGRYVVAIVRDASVRQRLREVERALAQRDEFLSVAGHELRTPITSLRGYAQLLMRRAKEPHVSAEMLARGLEAIDQSADRLNRLVRQLLDMSRLQSGRLELEYEEVDVAELARQIVEAAQRLTLQHRITLHTPDHLLARVDPLRVEQVLTNLVDNAVKYSPRGGDVEVSLQPVSGERLQVMVRDYGLGIPHEKRTQVFDRYFRGHRQEHISGMGLGLYVSRQIVELHGGTIGVEFPEEGGTRFIVDLPTRPPATADQSQSRAA